MSDIKNIPISEIHVFNGSHNTDSAINAIKESIKQYGIQQPITIDENNVITDLKIIGGCTGNTAGIEKLCIGRNAHEISKLLCGIQCQGNTSCPDQLSKAINLYYENKK